MLLNDSQNGEIRKFAVLFGEKATEGILSNLKCLKQAVSAVALAMLECRSFNMHPFDNCEAEDFLRYFGKFCIALLQGSDISYDDFIVDSLGHNRIYGNKLFNIQEQLRLDIEDLRKKKKILDSVSKINAFFHDLEDLVAQNVKKVKFLPEFGKIKSILRTISSEQDPSALCMDIIRIFYLHINIKICGKGPSRPLRQDVDMRLRYLESFFQESTITVVCIAALKNFFLMADEKKVFEAFLFGALDTADIYREGVCRVSPEILGDKEKGRNSRYDPFTLLYEVEKGNIHAVRNGIFGQIWTTVLSPTASTSTPDVQQEKIKDLLAFCGTGALHLLGSRDRQDPAYMSLEGDPKDLLNELCNVLPLKLLSHSKYVKFQDDCELPKLHYLKPLEQLSDAHLKCAKEGYPFIVFKVSGLSSIGGKHISDDHVHAFLKHHCKNHSANNSSDECNFIIMPKKGNHGNMESVRQKFVRSGYTLIEVADNLVTKKNIGLLTGKIQKLGTDIIKVMQKCMGLSTDIVSLFKMDMVFGLNYVHFIQGPDQARMKVIFCPSIEVRFLSAIPIMMSAEAVLLKKSDRGGVFAHHWEGVLEKCGVQSNNDDPRSCFLGGGASEYVKCDKDKFFAAFALNAAIINYFRVYQEKLANKAIPFIPSTFSRNFFARMSNSLAQTGTNAFENLWKNVVSCLIPLPIFEVLRINDINLLFRSSQEESPRILVVANVLLSGRPDNASLCGDSKDDCIRYRLELLDKDMVLAEADGLGVLNINYTAPECEGLVEGFVKLEVDLLAVAKTLESFGYDDHKRFVEAIGMISESPPKSHPADKKGLAQDGLFTSVESAKCLLEAHKTYDSLSPPQCPSSSPSDAYSVSDISCVNPGVMKLFVINLAHESGLLMPMEEQKINTRKLNEAFVDIAEMVPKVLGSFSDYVLKTRLLHRATEIFADDLASTHKQYFAMRGLSVGVRSFDYGNTEKVSSVSLSMPALSCESPHAHDSNNEVEEQGLLEFIRMQNIYGGNEFADLHLQNTGSNGEGKNYKVPKVGQEIQQRYLRVEDGRRIVGMGQGFYVFKAELSFTGCKPDKALVDFSAKSMNDFFVKQRSSDGYLCFGPGAGGYRYSGFGVEQVEQSRDNDIGNDLFCVPLMCVPANVLHRMNDDEFIYDVQGSVVMLANIGEFACFLQNAFSRVEKLIERIGVFKGVSFKVEAGKTGGGISCSQGSSDNNVLVVEFEFSDFLTESKNIKSFVINNVLQLFFPQQAVAFLQDTKNSPICNIIDVSEGFSTSDGSLKYPSVPKIRHKLIVKLNSKDLAHEVKAMTDGVQVQGLVMPFAMDDSLFDRHVTGFFDNVKEFAQDSCIEFTTDTLLHDAQCFLDFRVKFGVMDCTQDQYDYLVAILKNIGFYGVGLKSEGDPDIEIVHAIYEKYARHDSLGDRVVQDSECSGSGMEGSKVYYYNNKCTLPIVNSQGSPNLGLGMQLRFLQHDKGNKHVVLEFREAIPFKKEDLELSIQNQNQRVLSGGFRVQGIKLTDLVDAWHKSVIFINRNMRLGIEGSFIFYKLYRYVALHGVKDSKIDQYPAVGHNFHMNKPAYSAISQSRSAVSRVGESGICICDVPSVVPIRVAQNPAFQLAFIVSMNEETWRAFDKLITKCRDSAITLQFLKESQEDMKCCQWSHSPRKTYYVLDNGKLADFAERAFVLMSGCAVMNNRFLAVNNGSTDLGARLIAILNHHIASQGFTEQEGRMTGPVISVGDCATQSGMKNMFKVFTQQVGGLHGYVMRGGDRSRESHIYVQFKIDRNCTDGMKSFAKQIGLFDKRDASKTQICMTYDVVDDLQSDVLHLIFQMPEWLVQSDPSNEDRIKINALSRLLIMRSIFTALVVSNGHSPFYNHVALSFEGKENFYQEIFACKASILDQAIGINAFAGKDMGLFYKPLASFDQILNFGACVFTQNNRAPESNVDDFFGKGKRAVLITAACRGDIMDDAANRSMAHFILCGLLGEFVNNQGQKIAGDFGFVSGKPGVVLRRVIEGSLSYNLYEGVKECLSEQLRAFASVSDRDQMLLIEHKGCENSGNGDFDSFSFAFSVHKSTKATDVIIGGRSIISLAGVKKAGGVLTRSVKAGELGFNNSSLGDNDDAIRISMAHHSDDGKYDSSKVVVTLGIRKGLLTCFDSMDAGFEHDLLGENEKVKLPDLLRCTQKVKDLARLCAKDMVIKKKTSVINGIVSNFVYNGVGGIAARVFASICAAGIAGISALFLVMHFLENEDDMLKLAVIGSATAVCMVLSLVLLFAVFPKIGRSLLDAENTDFQIHRELAVCDNLSLKDVTIEQVNAVDFTDLGHHRSER